jgi:hypothetical protein
MHPDHTSKVPFSTTASFDEAERLSSGVLEAMTVFASAKMGSGSNVPCSDLLAACSEERDDTILNPVLLELAY